MRRALLLLLAACLLLPGSAIAWNAAGHRLVAAIAWQQLSPAGREFATAALRRHPDYPKWRDKARNGGDAAVFAEAATWADDIRNDPRLYDEKRDAPTPAIPGLADQARHKDWHYVDLDAAGQPVAGRLDRQLGELERLLRSTAEPAQIAWALPWLIHLVGDLHQPLHVGRHGDEGGNAVEIENPFNPRLPFTSLHAYWDDLPGPPWLRGKRLSERAEDLLARHPAPPPGTLRDWRDESHRLLAHAYPPTAGSLLATVDEDFRRQSRELAEQRLVAAGHRLGRLLEAIAKARVSRETP